MDEFQVVTELVVSETTVYYFLGGREPEGMAIGGNLGAINLMVFLLDVGHTGASESSQAGA